MNAGCEERMVTRGVGFGGTAVFKRLGISRSVFITYAGNNKTFVPAVSVLHIGCEDIFRSSKVTAGGIFKINIHLTD